MSEPVTRSPLVPAADAERVRARAVAAGRWFCGYLVAFGVGSAAWIVLLDAIFPDGFPHSLIAGAWVAFVLAANLWAERHAVYPAGASRSLMLATAAWFLLYLLLVGPLVRWRFDDALVPWVLAALLLSSPFFLAAAWIRARR